VQGATPQFHLGVYMGSDVRKKLRGRERHISKHVRQIAPIEKVEVFIWNDSLRARIQISLVRLDWLESKRIDVSHANQREGGSSSAKCNS
jgi:hypothetical protein